MHARAVGGEPCCTSGKGRRDASAGLGLEPGVEKIPLLVLSLMSCAVTLVVQKESMIATNRITCRCGWGTPW